MEGIFDDPMGGLDFTGLGLGKSGIIPNEEEIKDPVIKDDLENDDQDDNTFIQRNSIHIPQEDEFEELDAKGFFESFKNEGIITLEEGESIPEDVDLEWFSQKAKAKLQADLDEAIEEYKNSLPDEIKYLLDNRDNGVSIYELINSDKRIKEISSITTEQLEDSEDTQKSVLAQFLRLSGETDEAIRETLVDYEDSGLLSKMAKRAHTKLVAHETAEKERMIETKKNEKLQQQQAFQNWQNELKETIDKKTEIFKGIELNEKQRKELYKGLTQFDNQGKNAVMRFREAHPDFDLQVAYLATVLKGDMSIFENIAKSKAVQTLKEQASSVDSSSSKGGSKLKGVNLNVMRKALNL